MGKKVLLFFMIVFCQISFAQDTTYHKPLFKEKCFMLGIGQGIDSLSIPEGRYDPFFFMGHFGIDLLRNKKRKPMMPGFFMVYFEPQLNPVFIRHGHSSTHNLEFGMNVGFKHMYPLTKNIYTFILIGSGPHFITAHTTKQARGFIFSDNLGAGLSIFTGRNICISPSFRIRHISNADTRAPNHGINTFNYYIGISRFIR